MKMNNKNTRKAYAYGSMVRKPMQMGGSMPTSMNPMMPRAQQSMPESISPVSKPMGKMAMGGEMKPVPSGNSGLGKLPKDVRNNMGYMSYGGKMKKS